MVAEDVSCGCVSLPCSRWASVQPVHSPHAAVRKLLAWPAAGGREAGTGVGLAAALVPHPTPGPEHLSLAGRGSGARDRSRPGPVRAQVPGWELQAEEDWATWTPASSRSLPALSLYAWKVSRASCVGNESSPRPQPAGPKGWLLGSLERICKRRPFPQGSEPCRPRCNAGEGALKICMPRPGGARTGGRAGRVSREAPEDSVAALTEGMWTPSLHIQTELRVSSGA